MNTIGRPMDALSTPTFRRPDPSRHAAPQVFDELREMIISLRLAPGAVLSRVELQKQFMLSSTPIRDALMRLQEEGLVEIYPQRATVVSLIDVKRAKQAQFLRRGLEQEAVRLLAETPVKGLGRRLEKILRRHRDLVQNGSDYDRLTDIDHEFHSTMFEAAGAPDIWILMRRHNGHIDRIRRLYLPLEGKAQQIIRDHEAIAAAILAGDSERALTEMRDHLSRSIGYWDELHSKNPGYFRF